MPNTNAFDDVLLSLKVSGMCLLAEEYLPPWAVAIPSGRQLGKAIGATPDTRVLAFHLVRKGSFTLTTEQTSLEVNAHEVVILTGGQKHLMENGSTDEVMDLAELVKPRTRKPPNQYSPDATGLICGAFLLRNTHNNPLVASLPDIIRVDVSARNSNRTLHLLAELLASQTKDNNRLSGTMSARILEMFCAQAIRVFYETDGTICPGWFQGLHDAKIGAALNHIHADPRASWSVAKLAGKVGMSPSRFAARFRQVLKTSPMHYVTSWRMNMASRMLTETDDSSAIIAHNVGYESTPAFTRAFTRHYNAPPARWRREQMADN